MKLLKTRDSRRRNWVVSEWVAKEGGKERQQQQHTKKKKAPKDEETTEMVQNAKTLKRVENKRMAWGVINSKLNPSLVLFNSVVACISSFCWVVLCLRSPWGNQIRLEREEKHNTKNIRTEQARKKTHSKRWRRRPTTMSRERRKLKEIRECKKESLQRESSWNCEFRINSYFFSAN